MNYRVAICILNWQQYKITLRCLQSVLQLQTKSSVHIDILVIDNGSEDDSTEHLSRFIHTLDLPNIRLLASPRNLGYAGGNNMGIEYALEHLAPDFIWILNNDTLPSPESLMHLLRDATARPGIQIWGSTLLEADGHTIQCAGGYYYRPCLSTHRAAFGGRDARIVDHLHLSRQLDYISGAAMLIRARLLRDTGLLNPDYFLFFEELDLARRLSGNDRLAWCKASTVIHLGGASMPLQQHRQVSTLAEYHANLNALRFTRRYHPQCLPLVACWRFFGKLGKHLFHARWYLMTPLFRAYKDYFSNGK